jgi:hypothetical protein
MLPILIVLLDLAALFTLGSSDGPRPPVSLGRLVEVQDPLLAETQLDVDLKEDLAGTFPCLRYLLRSLY